MRNFVLRTIALGSLLLSVQLAAQTSQTFTLQPVDIVFTVPAGWMNQGDIDLKTPFVVGDPYTRNMIMVAAPELRGPMSAITQEKQRQVLESLSTGGKRVVSSGETKLAGIPAFHVVYEDEGGALHCTRYYMIANDHMISFSFLTPEKQTAAQHPVLSQVLSSVKFQQPPRVPQAPTKNPLNLESALFHLRRFSGLLAPLAIALYFIFRRKKPAGPTAPNSM